MAVLSSLVLLFAAAVPPARADRLVFRRGDALFVSAADGSDARRIVALPAAPGKDAAPAAEPLWAVSPDGHRLVWAEVEAGDGDDDAPAPTLYLSDLSGRRRKRLLAVGRPLDRQGRRVTALSDGSPLANWAPRSLSFSADGRTLYLGGVGPGGRRATVAADAATGAPLVDAEGRWKVIAPLTDVDARGTRLVGVGASGPAVLDLTAGMLTALKGIRAGGGVSLSPDGRRIAYPGQPSGLFTASTTGGAAPTAVPGVAAGARVLHSRWATDGTRLYALLDAPGSRRLVSLPAPGATSVTSPAPTTILNDPTLGGFDVVPD